MNLESSIQLQGILAEQCVSGYIFQILPDGYKFRGRLNNQIYKDPALSLGSDPRESAILSAIRSEVPASLINPDALSQVRLSQLDPVTGAQVGVWMVVNRDDNPAEPNEVSFELVHVTPDDE